MNDEQSKSAKTDQEAAQDEREPSDRDEWQASVVEEAVVDEEVAAEEALQEAERQNSLVPFDPLQRYLSEIRHYRILTREEEKEIAAQYDANP